MSLVSAKGILDNLDKSKYEIVPIKITKENVWISPKELQASYTPVIPAKLVSAEQSIDSIDDVMEDNRIDVVFPVLHGPYGEDGTIQGMLELMRLPYVGCGVSASAVCMDKVLTKNICASYQIPLTPFFWFTAHEWQSGQKPLLKTLLTKFGGTYPLFVKPANQGSSVGVTCAHNEKELVQGIELALTRDTKVLVEAGVANARELECSVLGANHAPETSVLGEIIPGNEFYDYDAKYLANNSRAVIPAKLPKQLAEAIRQTARLAFQVLGCSGLARADFLLDNKLGQYYLNELNTMPGFTPISMYPKLWEASGLSYPKLLDRLIQLALERHNEKSALNFSR